MDFQVSPQLWICRELFDAVTELATACGYVDRTPKEDPRKTRLPPRNSHKVYFPCPRAELPKHARKYLKTIPPAIPVREAMPKRTMWPACSSWASISPSRRHCQFWPNTTAGVCRYGRCRTPAQVDDGRQPRRTSWVFDPAPEKIDCHFLGRKWPCKPRSCRSRRLGRKHPLRERRDDLGRSRREAQTCPRTGNGSLEKSRGHPRAAIDYRHEQENHLGNLLPRKVCWERPGRL